MPRVLSLVVIGLGGFAVACSNPTGTVPVPIQFESTIGGSVNQVAITSTPSSIRVVGGYQGSACGDIGAFAVIGRSTLRLTVGPPDKESPCDAMLVTYNYVAVIPDLIAGSYSVEVYHRANGGDREILATRTSVSVQ
jgi:hypothetical protein